MLNSKETTSSLGYVVGAHAKAPLLDGSLATYINLDNAASTPALVPVLEAVTDCMQWYSSVHRGEGYKSQVATRAYDEAHNTVASFVGANAADHTVIFGKNATEAINTVAHRLQLKKTDVVITSLLEHHSNELPWRAQATVRHIELTPDGGLDMAHYKELLRRYKGRVKLVAVTGASNVTGFLPDIHTMAVMAHAAGAQILIDAAQLAAHRPIRMGRLDEPGHLDYVAISAHKMYAPFGTGALIGRRDTFAQGAPFFSGGGTIEFVTSSSVDWTIPPERDEAGSPNVVGAVALATAIREIERIGFERIVAHEKALTNDALKKLGAINNVTIYGDTRHERSGVITFNAANFHHNRLATLLSTRFGIGTRHGCFCAHPYVMRLLGVRKKNEQRAIRQRVLAGDKTNIPGMVRISFGLYNSKADIDAFISALEQVLRDEKP